MIDPTPSAARWSAGILLAVLAVGCVAFFALHSSQDEVHVLAFEARTPPSITTDPVDAVIVRTPEPAERVTIDDPTPREPVAVTLEPTRVAGRVTNGDGEPVRAYVRLQRASDEAGDEWTNGNSRSADAAGEFAVKSTKPGRYRLYASHPQHGTAVFGPIVLDGSARDVRADLELAGDGVLAGIVRDRDGEAVPHMELRARVVAPESHADGTGFSLREFESDRDGRFRIEGLVVGEFMIEAERFDHWSLSEVLTPVPVRSVREDLELLSECSRLVVRVRDVSGALVRVQAGPNLRRGDPARHAVYVTALTETGRVLSAQEHQYRAKLHSLDDTTCSAEVEPGFRYVVGVVSREHALVERFVTFDGPGALDVELQLGPRAPGTALDMMVTADGVENARWLPVTHELRSPTSGALVWRSESRARLGRVPIGPGEYDYRARRTLLRGCGHSSLSPDRWAPSARRVDARPGEVRSVDVRLHATGVLSLEVVADVPHVPDDGRLPTRGLRVSHGDVRRKWLDGVSVRLEREGGPILPVFDIRHEDPPHLVSIAVGWVPTNRRYETCRGIPAGHYRLVVEHEGLRTLERDVEIRSAETTEVRLTLLD